MSRLRITKVDDKHIKLEALNGINHFGFGTFLCDLKPDEVECDGFSKAAMLEATEQGGLVGMEIWPDNRIAWGDPSHSVIMPIEEISNGSGEHSWLMQIIPINGGSNDNP